MFRKVINAAFLRNQTFFVSVVFLFIFSVTFRFFFSKNFDSVGHNWDWGFPALPYMFERIRELSAYTWSSVGLGRSSANLQAHIPVNEMVSLLGSLFGVKTAIFIIFLLVFTVAFFSFKRLLDYFGKQKAVVHYLPSSLYAFSPFLFNEIIGGSWYMWVSYAFAPFLFLNLVKYVRERKTQNLVGYLAAASLVIISLQNFVTLEFILVLFLIISACIAKISFRDVVYQIQNYFFAHTFFILISLYWIIPFVDSWSAFYTMVTAASFTGNFEGVRTITQSILHIFLMTGYLDRNMYFYALPGYLATPFVFFVILFWAAVFVTFLFNSKKGFAVLKKNILLWLSILILLMFVIKGGNPPFGSATMYIFQNFPLMSLYRSPQHLMFAAAFIIPLLLSFVLHYYIAMGVSRKAVASLGFTVVFFWTSAWWYNGDLGSEILGSKKRDHIDFYSISSELKKVYDDNENNDLVHRILFLPTAFSPAFLANEYQKKAQGGQPEYTHLKNPTFNWEFNDMAKKIDDKFCYQKDFDFMNYLSLTNTRYIFLREDIYPHHSECGIFKIWNIDTVKKAVDAIGGLTPVDEVSGLYRVNDKYFLQHIFIPNRILISDREPEQFPKIVSDNYQVGTGVFLKKQNQGKDETLEELSQSYMEDGEKYESLEFKKIDPTRYIVRVQNSRGAFPLVFSESFHSGWKVYPKKMEDILTKQEFVSRNIHGTVQNDNLPSGRMWENWFREPFSRESSHLLANGYANAWIIDPKELCSRNSESCILNEDGTYDIVVVLEFWPQRLMYLGGFISVWVIVLYGITVHIVPKMRRKFLL